MSELANRWPDEIAAPELTEDEARKLTAEIKAWAGTLWLKLKEAHDGRAWKPLGYTSWAEYVRVEFDLSRSYSYTLISHADAVLELAEVSGAEVSSMADTLPPRVTRDADLEAAKAEITERVADLPDDATDEDRAALVADAVRNNPKSPAPGTALVEQPTEPEGPAPSGSEHAPVEPPLGAAAPGASDGSGSRLTPDPSASSPTPDQAPAAPSPSAGAGSPPKPPRAKQTAMGELVRAEALELLPAVRRFLDLDPEDVARAVARTDDRDEFTALAGAAGRWARSFAKTIETIPNIRSV